MRACCPSACGASSACARKPKARRRPEASRVRGRAERRYPAPMLSPSSSWVGLFDLFRIGIGPSSSHTVGPMVAARRFLAEIPPDAPVTAIRVELFGSLALTGKGHGTNVAVILGLLGERPDEVDPDAVPALVAHVAAAKELVLPDGRKALFDPGSDIAFIREMLPRHPTAVRFVADPAGTVF